MLIVYFLQHEHIMITQNILIENILVNNIPPKPEELRRNLTIETLEKFITKLLLLNFIPDNTAQKIHTPINIIIKITKVRCFFIGSKRGYENRFGIFI